LNISKIAYQTNRYTHCTGTPAIDAQAEIIKAQAPVMIGLGEAGDQLRLGESQGGLDRAGIAETARPQRYVDLVGLLFYETVIYCKTIPVKEIDRHSTSPSFGSGRSVNARQRLTVTVLHLY
jgi:hypothetical protein